jgi:predicted nucleic acid-binding protein
VTWIVDASVATKWFVREELHAEALLLLARPEQLAAPDLIVAEVGNIAWKKCLRGEITRAQAETMAVAISGYITALESLSALAGRALDLALELNHPVYDCLYLACAESLGGTLVTADMRFRDALHGTPYAGLVLHPGDPGFVAALSVH